MKNILLGVVLAGVLFPMMGDLEKNEYILRLKEENAFLRQRVEELKKQVEGLQAEAAKLKQENEKLREAKAPKVNLGAYRKAMPREQQIYTEQLAALVRRYRAANRIEKQRVGNEGRVFIMNSLGRRGGRIANWVVKVERIEANGVRFKSLGGYVTFRDTFKGEERSARELRPYEGLKEGHVVRLSALMLPLDVTKLKTPEKVEIPVRVIHVGEVPLKKK